MAETSEEKKLILKLMVDMDTKKVVFAEADREFVDFVFSVMSLRLSTITKLLLNNKKDMVGSIGALYKSIESLDVQCFKPTITSNSVLQLTTSLDVPLLSLHDCPIPIYFFCNICYRRFSDVRGTTCCNRVMREMSYADVGPKKPNSEYVNGGTLYMVMDNLEVKPMSIALVKTRVKKFDLLEERQVEVGLQEGLDILKASLETSTVLTNVFRKKYYDSGRDSDNDSARLLVIVVQIDF